MTIKSDDVTDKDTFLCMICQQVFGEYDGLQSHYDLEHNKTRKSKKP